MARLSREQSRIQTRSRIRGAAALAFANHGVGATSIDGIAEAAGYSRGAFYSNYTGKRDLLLELVTDTHLAEVAMWAGSIEQAPDLETLMAELAGRFDAYIARSDLGVLAIELQLEAKRDKTFGHLYRERDAQLMQTVEGLLRSLFAKADRPPPPDMATLARMLRALASGLVLQASGIGSNRIETGAGSIVTRVLRGVLGLPDGKDREDQQ